MMYMLAAQYDAPPKYPVSEICGGVDEVSSNDTLAKIFAGLVAYEGNKSCYVNGYQPISDEDLQEWSWQICSEMVMPMSNGNNSMLPPDSFDLKETIANCNAKYGVPPRAHWATTYYGGHDIGLALHKFGSNIIFSNGLRDPYSGGEVLRSISDTFHAVTTKKEGECVFRVTKIDALIPCWEFQRSHCLDILRKNHSTDPTWLVNQRTKELKIIKGWLAKYYTDLKALK